MEEFHEEFYYVASETGVAIDSNSSRRVSAGVCTWSFLFAAYFSVRMQ